MAATNNKAEYAASAAVTITLSSTLASSATFVAGRGSLAIDNSSLKYFDYIISGHIKTGTTTANTVIEVWVVPEESDTTWPDTFGGTDANVTVTTYQTLQVSGRRLAVINVPDTTARTYYFWASVAAALGTAAPRKFQIFVVHNTGANLDGTAGNHAINQKGVYSTSGG